MGTGGKENRFYRRPIRNGTILFASKKKNSKIATRNFDFGAFMGWYAWMLVCRDPEYVPDWDY